MAEDGTIITTSVELVEVNCGCCGGVYAINKVYHQRCYDKGLSWRCPYPDCNVTWGWSGSGAHKKELKRLERLRKNAEDRERHAHQRAEAALADAKHADHRARGFKGQLTQTKKRIGKGQCPCCQKPYVHLARHMEKMHPEYEDGPVKV